MIAALVAAGCTGPTGTDRAPAYFEGLRPVATAVTGAIAEVRGVLAAPYETEVTRQYRLAEVRAGYDLAIAADRAERLEPGSVYQADHDRYLETIDGVREAFRAYDAAAAEADAASAAIAATTMEVVAGLGYAGLSAEYCAKVTFDMRLCDRPADPGAYDAALFTGMLDLAAGYIPLLRPAPAALDVRETAAYLQVVDAAAADRLDAVAASLAAASPPAEAAADHAALLGLLDDAAALHRAGGDHAGLPALFCATAASLSTPAADLAAVLFSDDDLDCRP